MASNTDDIDENVVAGREDEPILFRLRSYQEEMVLESLKANIIVAMDTGSGKTHIALARTAVELETCHPSKLVWFLTPTVALCEQQAKVFETNLPSYGLQILIGKDGVDRWTDQITWDAVFDNVRIVLSTYQVLLDALTHGFVKMSKLALIIFDEAHHCTGKHAANMVLANFYIPYIHQGENVQLPRILGLSASPVQKATASSSDLQQIELNMNATAKTPKTHRSELLRFVHRPELLQINYPITAAPLPASVLALQAEVHNYELGTDPYIVGLLTKQREGFDVSTQLEKVFTSHNTYCYQQLKMLLTKSKDMAEELGASAAEWYLRRCVGQFDGMMRSEGGQLLDWSHEEKEHLAKILQRLPLSQKEQNPVDILQNLSPKVEALIKILGSEASPNFTGLVFIEQRVWVAALYKILTLHPKTRHKFNIGTFIGSSGSSNRKANIANFPEPPNQQETLDRFRAGETNLILATSVLEEGIDVSSCHLVICFERPKNLKSFIQRRGRARKQKSKYFIFLLEAGGGRPSGSWELLEEEMKRAYLDDMRKVEQTKEREEMYEDGVRFYRVENTGALLTLDNASQHLHHFCSTSSSSAYVDARPQFDFKHLSNGRLVAKVMLPLSVIPDVRTARGSKSWATERMAAKDASFEAYVALHEAGLVNDNLLPSRDEADDQAAEFQIPDNTPSLVNVSATLDPWIAATVHVRDNSLTFHQTLLKLTRPGEGIFFIVLLTPVSMSRIPQLKLYWNSTTQYTVESSWLPTATFTQKEIETIRGITRKILASIFSLRMLEENNDFVWLLVPSDSSEYLWSHDKLIAWHISTGGLQPATNLFQQDHLDDTNTWNWGLTNPKGDSQKFIPKRFLHTPSSSASCSSTPAPGPCIQAIRVPKRRDFLHPVAKHDNVNDAYTRIEELDASRCLVDNLPAIFSVFALLAPSIMHRYETYMIADTLRTNLLAPLELPRTQLPMVLQALTASVTGEESNYQRLEFLGDCILKYVASVHLMAVHPNRAESFLTGKKGRIVSNGFAARSALSNGLDKFILTKRFTGAKWAPRYIGDNLKPQSTDGKRVLSSKVLADIIESLIGVSYLAGGFSTAFTCIQTLLPSEKWTSVPEANNMLFEASSADVNITDLSTLETLIGYTFNKKMILLDALTHPSYAVSLANSSYERLEFLGDAILDYIISKRLYAQTPAISHQKMHAIRTAMANAAFLCFRMFETTIFEERTTPSTLQKEKHERCLWQFMRSGGYQLQGLRDVAIARHKEVREEMLEGLREPEKNRFPWHLLALTDAPKFLSDIVESVIGAIYVDSHGNIEACEIFVRRLGILSCLEQILRDNMDCLHPKERLGHLAVERDVKYVRVTGKADYQDNGVGNSNEKMKGRYKVQVKVGGENIGGVVGGLKRLNAETVAAWEACRILEETLEADQHGTEEEWFDAEEGGGIEIEDAS